MGKSEIKIELLIHDLKVPISVIDAGVKSLLNRLDTYGPLTEKQQKVLKRILRNTNNTKRIVNDVLELGRSSEGIMLYKDTCLSFIVSDVLIEIFDLSATKTAEKIRKCATLKETQNAAAVSGVKLLIEKELWEQQLYLDENKVIQILRNLITNALKFRSEIIEILCEIKEDHLIIVVKDDGRGVAEADQERIFNSYFSCGSSINNVVESHGIGLAGVMVLLKDMGGELILTSDVGKGAEFLVKVPLNVDSCTC
ncbi:MAG: HAMP domain-containing histidine kinase [Desulfobacteraceae bacterium]|nr:HAMP domain-containing histidine kinase [Desulfobacteraceae bacterium]